MTVLLSIFKILPWWIWPVAGLLGFAGWKGHEARIATNKATTAQQAAVAASKTAELEKEQRDELQRNIDKRAVIAAMDAQQAAKDRAAAVAANTRAVGVLKRADELIAAGRAQQAASAIPGSAPSDELGSAFRACVNDYQQLGIVAVDAVRRGKRCEAEADSMSGDK